MRRRRKPPSTVFFIFVVCIGVIVLIPFILFRSSPAQQAKAVTEAFYKHEQEGDFGGSWELFHSQMQEKFSKSDYIQTRNHVFVGHFGVTTFDLKVGKPDLLGTWKMAKESPPLKDVYTIPINQVYKSSFGTFTIEQDIFVAKEEGEWKILWSYQ